MRRMDADEQFFKSILGSIVDKGDAMVYNIAPNRGIGNMISYNPMEGIEIIYNDFTMYGSMKKGFELDKKCIEINYCLEGHMEAELVNNKYIYMTSGDIGIFGYNVDILNFSFSDKHCKGITVMLYLPEAINSLNSFLDTDEFREEDFFDFIFRSNTCLVSHGNEKLDNIFKAFYLIPVEYRKHFLKIKVAELILSLMSDAEDTTTEAVYFQKNYVDKIKKARRILVDNLDRKITLPELADMVGTNVTDLEKGFKGIYGNTVFNYMKKYRMQKAMELLTESQYTVLEISLLCGYANSSKFAKNFKETYGMTPLKYRNSRK
ncbi:helix-turn-helix transcriptional regulator [Clostridium amazonitimonense]|uniref:helix-turn-helix transcriptional regulator n=1 Tax=Clostridium amazonitimonense TaxID=1499689 RepID=UPI00050984DE|nr:helix-turn-helix domain-containing protein [Clostridium amazonitimonense]